MWDGYVAVKHFVGIERDVDADGKSIDRASPDPVDSQLLETWGLGRSSTQLKFR
jgi:hypothetical protein